MKANKVQIGDTVFCLSECRVRKVSHIFSDPDNPASLAFTWDDHWTSYYKADENLLVWREGLVL